MSKPLTDCSSEQSGSKQHSTVLLGFRGHFQTQKTRRHWLSLSGLAVVSKVGDVRGSDAIYQEKTLSKYLVNQGTHTKYCHKSSW